MAEQTATKKRGRKQGTVTDEHKAAMAAGRKEAAAVRRYLESINSERDGRRRRRGNPEERLKELQAQPEPEDVLARLERAQMIQDLEHDIAAQRSETDSADLEKDFVAYAAAYGARKGITWTAWRAMGVPAALLRDAQVPRTRS